MRIGTSWTELAPQSCRRHRARFQHGSGKQKRRWPPHRRTRVGLAHLESHHAGDVVLVRCLDELRNGVKELRSRLGVEARPSGASRFSAGKRAVDLRGSSIGDTAARPQGRRVDDVPHVLMRGEVFVADK